ncbi:g9198 [Coccomyxa elongata]
MIAQASSALVQVPLVKARTSNAARPTRQPVLVSANAESTRREAMAVAAGAILLGLTGKANAKVEVPFHASINRAGSSTEASQSGYGMEGTKKRGINPAQRKKLLAAIKDKLPTPQ